MLVQIVTCQVQKQRAERLLVSTQGGVFAIEEKDGALVIRSARPMFVQWDGRHRCEVRQVGGSHDQEIHP